eukprot:2117632-Prymnesium_polylepis.1
MLAIMICVGVPLLVLLVLVSMGKMPGNIPAAAASSGTPRKGAAYKVEPEPAPVAAKSTTGDSPACDP